MTIEQLRNFYNAQPFQPFVMHLADVFGYEFQAYLATRPEKSIGSEEVWEQATDDLRRAMEMRGLYP